MHTALELVGLIYKSAADASQWQKFLDAFVNAVGGLRAGLLIRDSERDEFAAVCWSGWPSQDIRLYLERYGAIDPWRIGVALSPEGTVAADFEFCPRDELESSAAFREFYAPSNCVHGMGGVILVTATGQSVITAVRGAEDGPFGEPEKAILRSLMPHLKQAALLHGELGALRRQIATFTAHLDRYPHALLLTDARRRLLYANSAAREIAALRDGVGIDAGQVMLTSRKRDTLFRQAVSQIASARDAPLLRLEVPRASRQKPLRLMLMPAEDSRVIPLGVSQPAIAIVIVDSDSQPELNLEVLQELFSLTPTEARVIGRLVRGRNVGEIATESRISTETVRTHVKRALAKTSTRTQGELISLILRTVPFRA